MIGPCVMRFEIEHNLAGGFIELTLLLIDVNDGKTFGRKVERLFPNTTLQVGPFQANIRFADATLSCPLETYLMDFNGELPADFRPEDLDTLSFGEDSLDGNQQLP